MSKSKQPKPLLSTMQMPPGVPVATVAVNGTKNAVKKERARYDQSADEALAGLKSPHA
ncbi:MAG: AIR carboxylase family protein [Sulfuricella sp.]|nr:AIR carboxylase family protein [Sulfuricella sp.]